MNSQNRPPPAFQEYASDTLANIEFRLLSLPERGLRATMRLECWVNVYVPANPQELAKIKQQNLAHRWFVRAEAVCPSGYQCRINSVKHIGNNENTGSATFQIDHQRWRGSAGSSGSAFIECGFNHSNSYRSTSVNAVCQ